MDRLIVRRGKRGSVLLAVAVTLPALLLLAGINQHLHSGQHVHLPDGRRRTKPLRVTDQTEWHVNATNALAEWRSALLGNMLDLYKRTEAAAYNGSDTPIVRIEPAGFNRYALFDAIVLCPDGGPPRRVGSDGDGGKWLCPLDAGLGNETQAAALVPADAPPATRNQSSCIVYSVGSNNQFDFEEAMLKLGCSVHTFDCFSPGTPASLMEGRHFFHRVCLGHVNYEKDGRVFQTLDTVLKANNHSYVDILKIDIEGYEFEVLSGFHLLDSCAFPAQISIELHYHHLYMMTPHEMNRNHWDNMLWPMHELSLAELVAVFGHLADLGYAATSREDNPMSVEGCCVEYSFIRVERPAHC
ncbi:hypothetical protein D9Q98_004196 [Chlorella vulgaris]|uniref:Methyltransferase domain-containing protein n=1 Tax=Chlorella vulgaris TaxID=3077 RepID=A0A9D4TR92_CHLVU|nr:hypothetical protein D9Q98_004196 [Chlorella vulgaris]